MLKNIRQHMFALLPCIITQNQNKLLFLRTAENPFIITTQMTAQLGMKLFHTFSCHSIFLHLHPDGNCCINTVCQISLAHKRKNIQFFLCRTQKCIIECCSHFNPALLFFCNGKTDNPHDFCHMNFPWHFKYRKCFFIGKIQNILSDFINIRTDINNNPTGSVAIHFLYQLKKR